MVGHILNGREERIRTSDPLVPNEVRYQAAPLPDIFKKDGPTYSKKDGPTYSKVCVSYYTGEIPAEPLI
jgi:hypothetical protein